MTYPVVEVVEVVRLKVSECSLLVPAATGNATVPLHTQTRPAVENGDFCIAPDFQTTSGETMEC